MMILWLSPHNYDDSFPHDIAFSISFSKCDSSFSGRDNDSTSNIYDKIESKVSGIKSRINDIKVSSITYGWVFSFS